MRAKNSGPDLSFCSTLTQKCYTEKKNAIRTLYAAIRKSLKKCKAHRKQWFPYAFSWFCFGFLMFSSDFAFVFLCFLLVLLLFSYAFAWFCNRFSVLSCSFALTCLVLSHILVCAFLSLSHGFVPVVQYFPVVLLWFSYALSCYCLLCFVMVLRWFWCAFSCATEFLCYFMVLPLFF